MYHYDEDMTGSAAQFQLSGWIACAPFEEYLGMRIEEAGDGRAVLSMPFKLKLAQGVGLMHGGAITSLADTAVAMAIKSILPEGSDFVTVDLHLKFFAAVREGSVRAVARATPQDERKIVGVAEIFNGDTKVAEFNAFFIVKRRGPE
ncbi:PaaI family thioesterase [Geomonas agri]|uniref:PaaI family thioesterase n=1 Tax=Geomonas agri TaxID=2873702 RepID=UPI001CD5297E|nr:PaaI family thioesterase [Geomonas agri]